MIASAALRPRTRIDLEGTITIHPIGQTPGGTQIGRAWLIPNSGEPLEFRNHLVNRTAWADSYLSDQPAGYVFADEELANAAFVAMERLMRTDYEVRLPPSALDSSKRDEESLNQLKQRLGMAGYYADAPFDIRPLPARLEHADVARSITTFAPKLETYQAPIAAEKVATMSAEAAVRAWLRQFDNNDDVECATRLLDSLRMIEREDTVKAVRTFITKHPEFRNDIVVPFGSARDSSAIHSYFAADLQGTSIDACLALDEAMHQHGGRPILIVDDFVGSGGQGRDVLAAGFGREDLRSDLKEERTLFSTDVRSFLRHARIGFVFTAAWDDGIELIKSTAIKLWLNATVGCYVAEADIPTVAKALLGMPSHQVEAFVEHARAIGASLLESVATRQDNEDENSWKSRLTTRALGYGNKGMLLASPFNVPMQTFTPLWALGKVNGVTWTPLLPRRKKT